MEPIGAWSERLRASKIRRFSSRLSGILLCDELLRQARTLLAKTGIDVSTKTIERRLKEANVSYRPTTSKSPLSEKHIEERQGDGYRKYGARLDPIENVWGILISPENLSKIWSNWYALSTKFEPLCPRTMRKGWLKVCQEDVRLYSTTMEITRHIKYLRLVIWNTLQCKKKVNKYLYTF